MKRKKIFRFLRKLRGQKKQYQKYFISLHLNLLTA